MTTTPNQPTEQVSVCNQCGAEYPLCARAANRIERLERSFSRVRNGLRSYLPGSHVTSAVQPQTLIEIIDAALTSPAPDEPAAINQASGREGDNLRQRLIGRAMFLRNRGEIKSPDLMDEAARALAKPDEGAVERVRELVCNAYLEGVRDGEQGKPNWITSEARDGLAAPASNNVDETRS